jgi:predicted ABC-type ATPase
MIPQWKNAGDQVALFFSQLPNEDSAVNRVVARVAQGGHNILEPVIRRRFHAGIANFTRSTNPLLMRGNFTIIPARGRF